MGYVTTGIPIAAPKTNPIQQLNRAPQSTTRYLLVTHLRQTSLGPNDQILLRLDLYSEAARLIISLSLTLALIFVVCALGGAPEPPQARRCHVFSAKSHHLGGMPAASPVFTMARRFPPRVITRPALNPTGPSHWREQRGCILVKIGPGIPEISSPLGASFLYTSW